MSDMERLIAERDAALAEVERLTTERDEAQSESVRLKTELDEQKRQKYQVEYECDALVYSARRRAEKATAERDTARAEVQRLIAERDQPESRPMGREVGRFGLDGHYLDAMERPRANGQGMFDSSRPSDEDIWREAFMNLLIKMNDDLARLEADRALTTYRKRWPR